ncbi:hypothetical protein A2G06_16935 (plasmid) [Geobacter anodireducens]|nr:hypothetical protein A2G06_16935 [Geobacter anodireducens]
MSTKSRKPRTRKEMIAFLGNHFRYDTKNSWNRSSSFARNIKIHRINFPDCATRTRAYDLLDVADAFDEFDQIIGEFARRHDYSWQITRNGRSGGYLVLCSGGKKDTGYKSYCPSCGQRNFTKVPPSLDQNTIEGFVAKKVLSHNWSNAHSYLREIRYLEGKGEAPTAHLSDDELLSLVKSFIIDLAGCSASDKCGVCGSSRVNYTHPVYASYITGSMVGESCLEDYEDWSTDSLKALVDIVWDFDKTVDEAIRAFIGFCAENEAMDETVMVPKKVKVAVPVRKEAA